MKKFCLLASAISVLVLSLIFSLPASAQENGYGIRLRRDFGYGAGSNVRGTFTISLSGDESQVASVDFLIDGAVMARIDSAPFRFQFHTDTYGIGVHELSAKVVLADGRVEMTPSTWLNFVTPEEEQGSVVTIFVGMGGAILLSLVIFWIVQRVVVKRPPNHAPGGQTYGILGAAICPKCGKPFPRHIWGLNLMVGKLDRCEHCGKWSLTQRATPAQLQAAQDAQAPSPSASAPGLRLTSTDSSLLDDTRYVDDV